MNDERLGRYRLVRRIGAGGMAEVFRAELVGAEGVTRELVVKKILPSLSLDAEAVAMFVDEARLAARLRHPNVVQVYEFGRADDRYFLAMELVEGCDLAALLRGGGGRPMELDAAAWVFAELLEGLAYVHALAGPDGRPLGLVHRDVSPHNVLLGGAGEVKLADFGIATAAARVERAGEGVRGKFAYMAPEQAKAEPVDARADLFAVGAMLHEALSGQRMYPASTGRDPPEAVREGRFEALSRVAPSVHPSLAAVVARAAAPDRDARFADARTFRSALLAAFTEAGARPDRERLQALVRGHAERTSGAGRPASDRTLTAHEDDADRSATNDQDSIGKSSTSRTSGEGSFEGVPVVPSRSRRALERIGIAIGVFTLAILAERKTRPRAAAPTAVTVYLPDGHGLRTWFDAAPRAAAERACHCRVEARSYASVTELARVLSTGAADLAVTTTLELPALRSSGALSPAEASSDAATVRAEIRESLAAAGIVDVSGGARWMVPAAVDVVALGWRPSVPDAVAARRAQVRDALERAYGERTGAGLPATAGFDTPRDPARWTTWDLLTAAWSLRAPGGAGALVLPSAGYAATMSWLAATSPGAEEIVRMRTIQVDVWEAELGWDALFGSLGLVRDVEGPLADALRDPGVMLAIAPASALVRAGGYRLATAPRVDSWRPDDRGAREVAAAGSVGVIVGWVAARAARQPYAVRRVLHAFDGPAMAASLAGAWPAAPALTEAPVGDEASRAVDALLRDAPLRVAVGADDAASQERVVARIAALRRAARGANAFVGGGRWWVDRMHDAVRAPP